MLPHMKLTVPIALAALAGLLITQTGCSVLKPKPDLTRFYILRTPAATKAGTPSDTLWPAIRIGPGRIASYLDATPIAVQGGPNRIQYLDLHHWAESVAKGVRRALGEHLCQALNLKQVTLYPDPVTEGSWEEVRYTVNRMEGTLDGPVTLDVDWELVQQPSGKVLASARSVYVVPKGRADAAAYVQRLSEAVARWGDDLAAAIRVHRGV